MNQIGIMQGRLLPKDKKKYQVFPSETWEEELEVCKKSGFSAIELLFDVDTYYDNPILDKKGRDRIIELSHSEGVSISSVCADFFKKYGLFQKSQPTKEGNIFLLEQLIEACNSIQCKTILIPLVDEASICNRKDKEDLIEVIKLVDGLLKRSEVNLCFETTLRWPEMVEFVEEVCHPNIKIYYDIGNSAYLKYDPAEEIRKLSKWIGGVHIKDRNENGDNVVLGTGLVDFVACFMSLKEINYEGSYILETTLGENPIETAKTHLEFVKTFL